ncbi:hypothetical protein AB0N07_30855 [Streptomyces sp. NPDC051172]|uniref:hypothetical protein n=1 Tax=Streptomyces sp. NPDC051172 TaxID=3155796 RepID=UPI0034157D26
MQQAIISLLGVGLLIFIVGLVGGTQPVKWVPVIKDMHPRARVATALLGVVVIAAGAVLIYTGQTSDGSGKTSTADEKESQSPTPTQSDTDTAPPDSAEPATASATVSSDAIVDDSSSPDVSQDTGSDAYTLYSKHSGSLGYGDHAVDFDAAPPAPMPPYGNGVDEDLRTGQPEGSKIDIRLTNGQTIASVSTDHSVNDAKGCVDLLSGPTATEGGDSATNIPVGVGDSVCFRTYKGRIALLRVTSVSSKDAADWNSDHLEYTALVWNDPNAMTQQ